MPLNPSETHAALPVRKAVWPAWPRRAVQTLLLLLVMLWSLFLLGWLTLHWGILPHIDRWRPQIEERASQALGLPVRIARIEVSTGSWVPLFSLHDVVLQDRQGHEALRLPLVSASLSLKTLLTWRLHFAQLHVDGAQLEVRRDAQGHWHVGGLDLAQTASLDGSQGLDWFFEQTELVIRHGRLRWVDETRQAEPLLLTNADLVLRNGLRRHDLRLDADPPVGWGQRFSLRARFTQPLLARAGDWQRWSGSLYAAFPQADVAQLQHYGDLPFALHQGEGALRLWLDLQSGQWRSATLDLALDQVALRLEPTLPELALRQVTGRLTLSRDAQGVQLRGEHLGFVTDEGVSWPASQLDLRWRQPQDLSHSGPSQAAVRSGELSADHIDLAVLAQLAERLPLPTALRRSLQDMAPSGVLQGLQLSWNGPPEQPASYRVRGQFEKLSIAALPSSQPGAVGRPGWRNANLTLDANERGGQAELSLQDGALDLPGVFAESLVPLSRLRSKLVWQVKPSASGKAPGLPAIELRVQDAHFANDDASGDFQARWHTGPGTGVGEGQRYPGQLELSGHLLQGKGTRVARYLPLGIGQEVRDYVAQAVLQGQLSKAQFKVNGDLWKFPFDRNQEGDFRIAGHVDGLTLAYVPAPAPGAASAWPALSEVQGDLVFERGSMRIQKAQGRVWGLELKGVNGGIADLLHQPTLKLDGQVRGPAADGLRFVAASPVGGWLAHVLDGASASGGLDLTLGLTIPLHEAEHSTVKGQLSLAGNELRAPPERGLPPLTNVRGKLLFTERGFSVSKASAQWLGGESTLDLALTPDGTVKLLSQGQVSADGLRGAAQLGPVARLAGLASGQTPYRLQWTQQAGRDELLLSSPLSGLALNLPAPLQKPAEQSWPLKLQITPDKDPTAARDSLRLSLGSVLQADYQRDLSGLSPRVLRGAIAVGEALPAVAAGQVLAQVRLEQLNLDAWAAALRQQAEAAATPTAAADPGAGAAYWPQEIQLRAGALTVAGRSLTQLTGTVQRRSGADGPLWRVALKADQADGQIEYKPATTANGAGRLSARMGHLAVPAAEAEQVDQLLDQASQTAPTMDIVVEDFELRGHKLGRLEVQAQARGTEGREWRLGLISLANADAKLTGSGRWLASPRRRMALDFKLQLNDSGALIERLGMGKLVKGGKGKLQGQMAWNGSALSPDWAQTTGSMTLALDSGALLKADPGAARLLGVLNLQALPRRFLLDFRDVVQEGFSFDNVSGDVSLADGLARTNNLRIRGVQAVILMDGSADLRHEIQDLRLVVVPELNAGTASLAYAAINPAIGLGTFLAQMFLRAPLMKAGTKEFHVTGPWGDPLVTPVERAADAPLPNLDPPAAAPAAASAPGQSQGPSDDEPRAGVEGDADGG